MEARLAHYKRKRRVSGRRIFLFLLALLLAFSILVIASSLVKADRLMKVPPLPVHPYATNALPSFHSVSFRSGDGQLSLKAWLIDPEGEEARGTVIMVHGYESNRLPYGLDTTALIKHMSKQGFRVLAFDLRNSGESRGSMSSFGYAESQDVLAAIQWTLKNTPPSPLVLYAFGSGTPAVLRTLQQLDEERLHEGERPDLQNEAGVILDRIGALIADSPGRDSDAFIRARIRQENNPYFFWLSETTPYAIRLSVGKSKKQDFFSYFSSLPLPCLILGHEEDSFLKEEDYRPMIEERLRLQPQRTRVGLIPGQGHLTAFQEDKEGYLENLTAFFDRFFPLLD